MAWSQGPGGLEAWWPGCEHLVTKAILCQKFKAKLMENTILVEAGIFLEILTLIFQRARVFSSGEPCGTRCTKKSDPKPCVFKTFRQKVMIPYEVFVKSCHFVRVFDTHFSKSMCFFIGGTLRNQMHQKKLSKTMCF